MNTLFIEILGYIAATLTTIAFIPQVYQVYKTKDTKAISLYMFLLFNAGLFCWECYGLLLDKLPIIVSNGLMLCFSLYILFMKLTENLRKI